MKKTDMCDALQKRRIEVLQSRGPTLYTHFKASQGILTIAKAQRNVYVIHMSNKKMKTVKRSFMYRAAWRGTLFQRSTVSYTVPFYLEIQFH